MKKEVSNKFKYFNFIFTLLIVLYHFRSLNEFNINYNNDLAINTGKLFSCLVNHINFVSMTGFFTISGFLFYYNINNTKDALNKIKKRIKTLLIPYITWTLLIIILKTIIEGSLPFKSIKAIPGYLFFHPIDGPLWYILALLLLMNLSPIIIRIKKFNKKTISFFFVLFIVIWLVIRFKSLQPIINLDAWWWHSNMVCYVPSYMFGAYLGMTCHEKILYEKYNKRIIMIIGIVLLVVTSIMYLKIDMNRNIEYILYILQFTSLWMIIDSRLFKNNVKDFFNYAFFLYALHQPILIVAFDKFNTVIIKNQKINIYEVIILKIVEVITMYCVSLAIAKTIKKRLPKKAYSALCGGR